MIINRGSKILADGTLNIDGGTIVARQATTTFLEGLGDEIGSIPGEPDRLVAHRLAELHDALFGADLKDQYAAEAYFRWQLADEIAITPSAQLLIDPALNPDEDTVWVFGVRARLAF